MLCSNGIVIAKHIFFSETICFHEPYLCDVDCGISVYLLENPCLKLNKSRDLRKITRRFAEQIRIKINISGLQRIWYMSELP